MLKGYMVRESLGAPALARSVRELCPKIASRSGLTIAKFIYPMTRVLPTTCTYLFRCAYISGHVCVCV